MVGHHEDALSEHRDTSIGSTRRRSQNLRCARLAIAPDTSAVQRIQSMDLIGERDIHHAIHNHRSGLKQVRRFQGIHPGQLEFFDVALVNLIQLAVAITV